MRALVVPEFYRPEDPTANGMGNYVSFWKYEWLDCDPTLPDYLLLLTRGSDDFEDTVADVRGLPPQSQSGLIPEALAGTGYRVQDVFSVIVLLLAVGGRFASYRLYEPGERVLADHLDWLVPSKVEDELTETLSPWSGECGNESVRDVLLAMQGGLDRVGYA